MERARLKAGNWEWENPNHFLCIPERERPEVLTQPHPRPGALGEGFPAPDVLPAAHGGLGPHGPQCPCSADSPSPLCSEVPHAQFCALCCPLKFLTPFKQGTHISSLPWACPLRSLSWDGSWLPKFTASKWNPLHRLQAPGHTGPHRHSLGCLTWAGCLPPVGPHALRA